MFSVKKLFAALGSENLDCRQDGAKLDAADRAGYLFNTTIAGIEEADAILLIGTNPRWEAPLVNHRIRKAWLKGGVKIANIGEEFDLNYKVSQLGGAEVLSDMAKFEQFFEGAKKPMVIIGGAALASADVVSYARAIAEKFVIRADWNGWNVLHNAASRVAGLDLGLAADFELEDMKLVYLLAADEVDSSRLKNAFVVYQGHHGDKGARMADVVLPGAAYTEKDGVYLNLEGRTQHTKKAAFAPGDAREDWKIIRELSKYLSHTLPWENFEELRVVMFKEHPHFNMLDHIEPAGEWKYGPGHGTGVISPTAFTYPIQNFYMTDPISRNLADDGGVCGVCVGCKRVRGGGLVTIVL